MFCDIVGELSESTTFKLITPFCLLWLKSSELPTELYTCLRLSRNQPGSPPLILSSPEYSTPGLPNKALSMPARLIAFVGDYWPLITRFDGLWPCSIFIYLLSDLCIELGLAAVFCKFIILVCYSLPSSCEKVALLCLVSTVLGLETEGEPLKGSGACSRF